MPVRMFFCIVKKQASIKDEHNTVKMHLIFTPNLRVHYKNILEIRSALEQDFLYFHRKWLPFPQGTLLREPIVLNWIHIEESVQLNVFSITQKWSDLYLKSFKF